MTEHGLSRPAIREARDRGHRKPPGPNPPLQGLGADAVESAEVAAGQDGWQRGEVDDRRRHAASVVDTPRRYRRGEKPRAMAMRAAVFVV